MKNEYVITETTKSIFSFKYQTRGIFAKLSFFTIYVLIILLISGCNKKKAHVEYEMETKTDILIIYSNDNFINGGLSAIVIEEFEKRFECSVDVFGYGDSAALLNHLITEKNNPKADLAIGISSTQINRALNENIFRINESENIRNIRDRSLFLDRRYHLVPYNYDYYAFVYDSEIITTPPKTFGEMQNSVWNNKVIMPSPAYSSIGEGVVLWSLGIFGERGFDAFWDNLKRSILTVSNSMPESYITFQVGAAPIILSYVTNPIFHMEIENIDKFRAFIPEEGRLKEIEFSGIINGSQNLYLARRFMDFMLTYDFQKHIPTTIWKFPVIEGVELPDSFAAITLPERDLSVNVFNRYLPYNDAWTEQWLNIVGVK